jgi:hypothetical protein
MDENAHTINNKQLFYYKKKLNYEKLFVVI